MDVAVLVASVVRVGAAVLNDTTVPVDPAENVGLSEFAGIAGLAVMVAVVVSTEAVEAGEVVDVDGTAVTASAMLSPPPSIQNSAETNPPFCCWSYVPSALTARISQGTLHSLLQLTVHS